MSATEQSITTDPQLMVNWYATRIHIVGAETGSGSMSQFRSLCSAAYGDLISTDADRRAEHDWTPKMYSKLPVCAFCQRQWAKLTGGQLDISPLLPPDPPGAKPSAAKSPSRPWRVEYLSYSQKWRTATSLSTKEKALEEMAWCRANGTNNYTYRVYNRETGEVIE